MAPARAQGGRARPAEQAGEDLACARLDRRHRLPRAGGLDEYLDRLGFHLVGYGCTTCIGNLGPLPEAISEAVNEHDLVVCSVLSGNRNFEGRIQQDVRNNYLASPPLCVAYALAGRMDVDLDQDPLGEDGDGNPVYLRHLAER